MPCGLYRIRRCVGILGVLLVLGTTAGCTAGPSDRPAVAVRDADLPPQRPVQPPPSSTPLPPPGEYNPNSLVWQDCTDTITRQLGVAPPPVASPPIAAPPSPLRVDCTQLRVRADVSQPLVGHSLALDLSRVGNGPAPLVVIGEPTGEPGTVRAARLAGQLPPAMLDSVTLIGVARRGTGPSGPLECIQPSTRSRIVGYDPETSAPGQLESLLDITRTAIQTCVQDLGEMLTVINSTTAADDLEALRVALRAPVLNVLSHGAASRVVTDFARRYPTSVGHVVLDGAADPTLDAITAAEAALIAADDGYTAFAADCLARDCPLAPDPHAALRSLADALREAPLQVGEQWITAGTVYQAVLETIGTPERWAELAEALAATRNGDGAGLATLVLPTLQPTRGLPARFDPALATHCNDTPTRVPPERAEQLVAQWQQRSPLFGALFAQRLLWCSAWPVPSEPPEGPGERALPPVLVVATAADPVTPAVGARRTADALPSAVLVTWQGQAHGALPRSSCVVELVTRFLVDAVTPPPGTLCPP